MVKNVVIFDIVEINNSIYEKLLRGTIVIYSLLPKKAILKPYCPDQFQIGAILEEKCQTTDKRLMTHGPSCPATWSMRMAPVAAGWLLLLSALFLLLTARQIAKINKVTPTPTSTMATVEDFVLSMRSSISSLSSLRSVAELLGVAVERPEASPSIGITVHTIMTMPKAMSPTPRAHRA